LAQPLCPHHDVAQVELAHALQAELACTVSDLLVRRTKIAMSRCQGLDALSTVIDLLVRYGRVSVAEAQEQAEAYRRYLAQSLAFRAEQVPTHA
jgi:glycerol-3-phosphate dehydrogenase